ncbi:MAG: M56 family metallopeptidase [Lentisphaeria bacterium]|jgi:beta-lactamase regulating signal transducer with metallopeptidase domain|nr:M56 family metallopeptidase [Lentisphaeria bacterium]
MRFAEFISGLLPLVPPLARALLHSLWQGALIAGVCRFLLLLVPCRRPAVRYCLSLGSLAVVVLAFLVTWRLAMTPMQERAGLSPVWSNVAIPVAAEPPSAVVSPSAAPDWPAGPASSLNWNWQTVFGCLWLAGVVLMVLRAARILYGETRLAGSAEPCRNPEILAMAEELRVRLRLVRRVAVAVVDRACSPAVVGMVAPVILIPASLATGTAPACLRAILAHELAHVRRWDMLVNLFQLLVESLLFHNPFVWWLSAQVRQEREACCDADAAGCCGGGPAYARVLVEVGERVLADGPMVSLARPRGLADRVRRLLGLRPAGETWRLRPLSVAVALLAGFSSFLVLAQGTFKATDAVLSATERIELIEQAVDQQKEDGVVAVGTTRYTGRILTPEGNPPEGGTELVMYVINRPSETYQAMAVDRRTGRFDAQATGTLVMLWVNAAGYTPCFKGTRVPGTEPVVDFGDWILEPQTPLIVQILDDQGQPVPDADVRPSWRPIGYYSFYGRKEVTDANGECVLPLVADCPMFVEVTAAGFEPSRFNGLLPRGNEPLVLRPLMPSLPLELRIVDAESGAPIAGAKVRKLGGIAPLSSGFGSWETAPELGTSGTDGICLVHNLHRKGWYWLLVEAEGHGIQLVERMAPGQRREVPMGPPRIVTGTVVGDLGRLTQGGIKPRVYVDFIIRTTIPPYYLQGVRYVDVPVQVENGVGTFRIDTLFPGTFGLSLAGGSISFSVQEGSTDVRLDLSNHVMTDKPTREVRLVLVPDPGTPVPRGTMKVLYPTQNDVFFPESDLPVEDGVVTVQVPVGARVTYNPTGLVGGWFSPGCIGSVMAGDEPLTVHIPFIPAGAIAVSLVEADGKPADGFMVSVREVAKSPQRVGDWLDVEGKDTSSTNDGIYAFTATPLPLGGTYEVVVGRRFTNVTTGPVQLTERYPLHTQRLVLAGDATISGQVVDTKGNPVPRIGIHLVEKFASGSFGSSGVETDADGRFALPGVVRHKGSEYTVSIRPRRDFVPRGVVVADLDVPVRIVAEPGLVVSGRILDEENGSPIRGAEVWLWRKTDLGQGYWPFKSEDPTDEEGNFRFSNLLPGEYELWCGGPNAGNPRVVAGQAEPVVWRWRVPRIR